MYLTADDKQTAIEIIETFRAEDTNIDIKTIIDEETEIFGFEDVPQDKLIGFLYSHYNLNDEQIVA
jgi:hypothetical protein